MGWIDTLLTCMLSFALSYYPVVTRYNCPMIRDYFLVDALTLFNDSSKQFSMHFCEAKSRDLMS